MIMKNEIKFILPLIIFMLFYSGCSIKNVNDNYVIANIPVPSLGMKFLLFKGSSNLHKQRTYFITHIDSIDKANYPNPFLPMQDLEIRMFKADSVKIELLNPSKEFSLLVYNDKLEEGYYSLALEDGNYNKNLFIIRVTKNSKSWLYDLLIN